MDDDSSKSEIPVDDEIRLVQLREDDVDALFALVDRNRERLLDWFPERYVYSDKEDVWEDISPKGFIKIHSPSTVQMGIWYQGELAGVINTHPKFPEGTTYFIAYWIGKEYEGKGVITRSAKALVDVLFGLDWVQEVVIYCAVENTRSQAVPRRLGFTERAVIHNDELVRGKSFDEIEFVMTREAWLARKTGEQSGT